LTRKGIALFSLSLLGVLVAGCAPAPTAEAPTAAPATAVISTAAPSPTATPKPTQIPTATTIPLPIISLKAGENYFSISGKSAFLFSRNVTGYLPSQLETFTRWTAEQGDHFVRVILQNQAMGGSKGYGITRDGGIYSNWSDAWERFFDTAEAQGVYVDVIFMGWGDWNTKGFNSWADNPLNSANGGPAGTPREIYRRDSPTQKLYVQWFKSVVERWQHHRNILMWEPLGEINLVEGISQSEGLYLAEQLARAGREADPLRRPISPSLTDWSGWDVFLASDAVDIINFHPYPPDGTLDRRILLEVPRLRKTFQKPVLIGESGLHYATPDSEEGKITLAQNARVGLRHGIWADLVSGAMNGRAFWWEDSFGIYFPGLEIPWMDKYRTLEAPMIRFSAGVDMTGFQPLRSQFSGKIFGGAVGSEKMVIGWYRDAKCEPPDWPVQKIAAGQTVTLTVPGTAAEWKVDFYDTKNGKDIIASATVKRQGGAITVTLPEFTDDIAFKMAAL